MYDKNKIVNINNNLCWQCGRTILIEQPWELENTLKYHVSLEKCGSEKKILNDPYFSFFAFVIYDV